uniref:Uncharacterized protein n=1 Tax=Anopheles albimanus TaxID=7167 RepID=A0A182FPY2_ANOAL
MTNKYRCRVMAAALALQFGSLPSIDVPRRKPLRMRPIGSPLPSTSTSQPPRTVPKLGGRAQ